MEDLNLVRELVRESSQVVERDAAISAVRALCRYYGGQQLYIPRGIGATSKTLEELRGVLSDAVSSEEAEKILTIVTRLYGGFQYYIPMEKKAFRDLIANEIHETMHTEGIRALCRKYGVSFTYVYEQWHVGRNNKIQLLLPFMEDMDDKQ